MDTSGLTPLQATTIKSMLDSKSFKASDRRWLDDLMRVYREQGFLSQAQHKTMDCLLGVAGIKVRSIVVFSARDARPVPVSSKPQQKKRKSP